MTRAEEIERVRDFLAPGRLCDAAVLWVLADHSVDSAEAREVAERRGPAAALDWLAGAGWRAADAVWPPPATTQLVAARRLVETTLPDFWVSSGSCNLTGHATIGPDYNGPAGVRLRREWDAARYHSGFSADIGPPDGSSWREALALVDCVLQAAAARERDRLDRRTPR